MSRIGKLPVSVPSGVDVDISEGKVSVKGSRGVLSMQVPPEVSVVLSDNQIKVNPVGDSRRSKAMWGTVRSKLQNMAHGVSQGFVKTVETRGVGYRSSLSGNVITLSLGYSHDVKFIVPDDISIKIEKQTIIHVSGIDNQKVGQIAAELRSLRKPEPYKGKGVRYSDEYIRIKEGKKK